MIYEPDSRTDVGRGSIAGLLSAKWQRGRSQPGDVAHAAASGRQAELDARTVAIDVTGRVGFARARTAPIQGGADVAALARQDRTQARNASPTVTYTIPHLYERHPLGTRIHRGAGHLYCGITRVHEYLSQADVAPSLRCVAVANFRRMGAAAAVAKAQAEIASRGWWGYRRTEFLRDIGRAAESGDGRKDLAEEGDRFLKITQELEKGSEVALRRDQSRTASAGSPTPTSGSTARLSQRAANLAVLIFPDSTIISKSRRICTARSLADAGGSAAESGGG